MEPPGDLQTVCNTLIAVCALTHAQTNVFDQHVPQELHTPFHVLRRWCCGGDMQQANRKMACHGLQRNTDSGRRQDVWVQCQQHNTCACHSTAFCERIGTSHHICMCHSSHHTVDIRCVQQHKCVFDLECIRKQLKCQVQRIKLDR